MKRKQLLAGVGLVFLLGSCSGDKAADNNTPPSPEQVVPVETQTPPPVVPGGGPCLTIVQNSCLSCHSESRMCQKLGKKSERRWKRTIVRMIKRGAKLADDDVDRLVACLTNPSEAINQLCK